MKTPKKSGDAADASTSLDVTESSTKSKTGNRKPKNKSFSPGQFRQVTSKPEQIRRVTIAGAIETSVAPKKTKVKKVKSNGDDLDVSARSAKSTKSEKKANKKKRLSDAAGMKKMRYSSLGPLGKTKEERKKAKIAAASEEEEKSRKELRLQSQLESAETEMASLLQKVEDLETNLNGANLENDSVQKKLRLQKFEFDKVFREQEKQVTDLNETIEYIVQDGGGGSNMDVEKRLNDELLASQAEVNTLRKQSAALEEANTKMSIELQCFKDFSKMVADNTGLVGKLSQENQELKTSNIFKDETIHHLMEQLKDLKLKQSKFDGSTQPRDSQTATQWWGSIL